MFCDFKEKFNINDQLFYEEDYDSIKSEFDSFREDNTSNRNGQINNKLSVSKVNTFHLDIDRSNQYNLWGNIPMYKNPTHHLEVNFRMFDYNELISFSKKLN